MVDLLTTSRVSVHNFCTSKTCFDMLSLTNNYGVRNKNAKIKNFCIERPVLPKKSALFLKNVKQFKYYVLFSLAKGRAFCYHY